MAENNIWPEDVNAIFSYNFEENEAVSDTQKYLNDSNIFYLGAKTDPSIFWGRPNNILNGEWEEKQSPVEGNLGEDLINEKINIYKNNEVESDLRSETVNPNNKKIVNDETSFEDIMKSSEIEADYTQLYPEVTVDNIADHKNTIDLRSGGDATINYDKNFANEPKLSNHNFIMKLDEKNVQKLNLMDEAASFQLVPQYIEKALPRLTFNLPITSQPRLIMNTLSTKRPKHHHKNYLIRSKFKKSVVPYTFILPRPKKIYTHAHGPSTHPILKINR